MLIEIAVDRSSIVRNVNTRGIPPIKGMGPKIDVTREKHACRVSCPILLRKKS